MPVFNVSNPQVKVLEQNMINGRMELEMKVNQILARDKSIMTYQKLDDYNQVMPKK